MYTLSHLCTTLLTLHRHNFVMTIIYDAWMRSYLYVSHQLWQIALDLLVVVDGEQKEIDLYCLCIVAWRKLR